MLIAVDIDETIIKFIPYFLKWHNIKYGTAVKSIDLDNFDMSEKLECPSGAYVDRIFEFYDTRIMKKLSPIEGAVESMDYLSEKHKIIAITARSKQLEQITQNSIDKYFRNSIENLYLTGEWIENNNNSKAKICKEYGVDILIDDRPKYCCDAIDVGTKSILFNLKGNYGWGDQTINMENLYHSTSWKETIETIDNINK